MVRRYLALFVKHTNLRKLKKKGANRSAVGPRERQ